MCAWNGVMAGSWATGRNGARTWNGNANKNGLCAACAVAGWYTSKSRGRARRNKWEIQIQLVLNNSVSHYANELFYSGDALCCWYELTYRAHDVFCVSKNALTLTRSHLHTNRIRKMCDRNHRAIAIAMPRQAKRNNTERRRRRKKNKE